MKGHFERIEQAGNRVCITAGGVIHEDGGRPGPPFGISQTVVAVVAALVAVTGIDGYTLPATVELTTQPPAVDKFRRLHPIPCIDRARSWTICHYGRNVWIA